MRILLPMKLNETKKKKQNTQEKRSIKHPKQFIWKSSPTTLKVNVKSRDWFLWLPFFSLHLFAPPDSPLLKIPPLLPWSWGVSGWDLRSSGGMWSRWGDIPWRIFTKSKKICEMMNVLRMQCRPHPICSLIIRHSGTHSRESLWIFSACFLFFFMIE